MALEGVITEKALPRMLRHGPALDSEDRERRPPARGISRRGVLIVAALVAAAALLGNWLYAQGFQQTDDAQIDGNISAISSRVLGTVSAVRVVENQRVAAGDILVELDPTDLRVSLAEARAQLALASGEVEAERPNVSITATSNGASISGAEEAVKSARADLDAARHDLDQAVAQDRLAKLDRERGERLLDRGVFAQAEYDRLVSGADVAAAGADAAGKRVDERRARLAAATSRLDEVRANAPRQLASRQASFVVRQANLELARARLRQAELNLSYGAIAAPVSGIVGRKSVNVGDRIQPGQQLLFITQSADVWVNAYFRETQIKRMRVGSPAWIRVDATSRTYTGRVESFGGATGSRFSLLPPENASGNYVKVVQRLPVRIRLDAGQPDMDRLRPGMSVEPRIRVS